MKRIINIAIMLMLLAGIIVTSALYLSGIYNNDVELESSLLRSQNEDLSSLLYGDRETNLGMINNMESSKESVHYYVNSSGEVLYQTESDYPNLIDKSHMDNIIINDGIDFIKGEKLGQNHLIVSKKLSNGDYLVTSRYTKNPFAVFSDILPGILGLIGIGLMVTFAISNRIVSDFVGRIEDRTRDMDVENIDVNYKYVELYPLVRIIKDQKENLANQLNELEKQSNTINTIISNMHEGMILTDSELNILSINKAAVRFLDVASDPSEYRNKNLKGLIRDELFLSKVNHLDSGENFTADLKIKNRHISLFFNPVYSEDRTIGYVAMLVDDTRQKLVETQRAEFSANVSHELKTPLTSINGYAEMLKNGMVPMEDVPKFGNIIYDEGSKLLYMIDDIIKLSRLDEGKSDSTGDVHDLSSIVSDVIATLDQKAGEKNISINFSANRNYPFYCNYQLMRELFINLIDNAIKYNKVDGKIDISIDEEPGHYNVNISDTGIGISEENKARVFERFYTVDKSHNQKDSSGLGLAIVKHVVRLYRGSITLESEEGVGTTFIVRLPSNRDEVE